MIYLFNHGALYDGTMENKEDNISIFEKTLLSKFRQGILNTMITLSDEFNIDLLI